MSSGLAIGFALPCAFDSVSTLDSILENVLARAIASALDFDSASGLDLESASFLFEEAVSLSRKRGNGVCYRLLLKLSLPPRSASKEVWQDFSDELLGIFKTTFCVEDYEFTTEEAQHVADYLETTVLLFDCLKVAYVSNRGGIEDRLLRSVK